MGKRILWVDNDSSWTESYVPGLKDQGYEVKVVTKITTAEEAVKNEEYDLVILDVMIPTLDDEEEKLYPPKDTNLGLDTGLVFFRRVKEILEKKNTPVLVLTLRLDLEIMEKFVHEGLPRPNYRTKVELRDTRVLTDTIKATIRR